MLRLCKTFIRHLLYKKLTVNINVLSFHLVDTYGWMHHGHSYRTCYLLPALYHLECTTNGLVSSACDFMMPKTKRKSKHKKSKHSRRHKKAKYCIPEVIELSSSSSDNESDVFVIFDLKQERLRVASENIVSVPDSDNEDVCKKITCTEVNLVNDIESASNQGTVNKEKETNLVNDIESASNQGTVNKEKETITSDMGNTVGEGVVWNDIQKSVSVDVEHQQVENVPANCTYGMSYAYGNVYAGNMPANVYMLPHAQTEFNICAENVYPPSNALTETHTCVGITSNSWSSTFYGAQSPVNIWDVVEKQRSSLKKKRYWEKIVKRLPLSGDKLTLPSQLLFTVMSYNVLAQDLIHQHGHLYQANDPRALSWELRSQILMTEIKEANAEVLCLQEVQGNLLDTFYKKLNELGYKGIYKQRTGNNVDGVAIYYKSDIFELVDYTTVEYFQPNIDRLNRDNVGLVAKLACRVNPNKHLVVATTHLLFNPKRHDVKLSQIQVLLAEVERFAFESFRYGKSYYWPVILTGDMNFLPYSGVYKLLTEGIFKYEGCCSKTLEKHAYFGSILGKTLLPDSLQITDTCQHWGILCNRMVQKMDHKREISLLKIYNSDHQKLLNSSVKNEAELEKRDTELDTQNVEKKNSVLSEYPEKLSFGTGKLSCPIHFRSVYKHGGQNSKKREVTTNQKDWVTVDYIFYSLGRNKEVARRIEEELTLVARCKLLTADEAALFGPIPNFASPSDHYPLLATFLLNM